MNPVVGPYELVSELGRGGMGVVYLANEPALERRVAVKFLSDTFAGDDDIRERFLIEARSMARITDPHVVQVFAVGETEGHPYFAMEFLDGGSLDQLRRGSEKLAPLDAAHYVHQAALGLHAAHEADLVHRDIKPANLLLSAKGLLKVSDFGIAYAPAQHRSRLTATGGVVGTPGYLSPEICLGQPADARSDQFALGVVFFELLAGRVPFDDVSPLRAMLATVENEVPDLRQFDVAVPAGIEAVLRRMLAKRPEDRYADLGEVADALVALGVDTRLRSRTPNLGMQRPVARPSRLLTPATQVFGAGPAAPTSQWPNQTTAGPSVAAPPTQLRRPRSPVWLAAIAVTLLIGGVLAWRWWPLATPEPVAIAPPPSASAAPAATAPVSDTTTPSGAANPLPAAKDATATTPVTPPTVTTRAPETTSPLPVSAPPVVAPATTAAAPPTPQTGTGLPIAVIAVGEPRIAQAVSARIRDFLQARGSTFVDNSLQSQWLGLARQGGGTGDALVAAKGKAVAMVIVEPDEDEPGTYSVRVYDVRSRVSRGHWQVRATDGGDAAAASLDDFALGEIRQQVAGYGG